MENQIKPLACPHCAKEIVLSPTIYVSKDSRFTLAIEPQPGARMAAHTVGGMITTLDKLIEALGKDVGYPAKAMIESINTDANGRIEVNILVARIQK